MEGISCRERYSSGCVRVSDECVVWFDGLMVDGFEDSRSGELITVGRSREFVCFCSKGGKGIINKR